MRLLQVIFVLLGDDVGERWLLHSIEHAAIAGLVADVGPAHGEVSLSHFYFLILKVESVSGCPVIGWIVLILGGIFENGS